MKYLIAAILLLSHFGAEKGFSQSKTEFTFDEVWKMVEKNSPSLQSYQAQVDSLSSAKDRAARHWSPRLFVDARTMSTNDPTQAFMTILSQRQVQNTDFNPTTLNEPGTISSQRGALVLDLPIYEGGGKQAQAGAVSDLAGAAKEDRENHVRELKAKVIQIYSSLLTLSEQQVVVSGLYQEVDRYLSQYQLRRAENPVAYSGYLGLQSLKNRLHSGLETMKSQEAMLRSALETLASELPAGWKVTNLDREKYEVKIDPSSSRTPIEKSAELRARAARQQVDIEKSQWLPKVGAFGEVYSFKGDRATSQGSTVGLYLQWGFSGQLIGGVDQAKKAALAAEYQTQAMGQKLRIETQMAEKSLAVIKQNLTTIEASLKLMQEQVILMRKLYQSGAVNGLQLAEVFNRHFEMINQKSELQKQWSETISQLIILSTESESEEGVRNGSKS
ncbi:MAG: hypothetical protein BroJett040_02180 [Oligoflexia bacterium]|nr:MAG: hypothetical protein BroJett040_02180 [Oligoflexia bacterium]